MPLCVIALGLLSFWQVQWKTWVSGENEFRTTCLRGKGDLGLSWTSLNVGWNPLAERKRQLCNTGKAASPSNPERKTMGNTSLHLAFCLEHQGEHTESHPSARSGLNSFSLFIMITTKTTTKTPQSVGERAGECVGVVNANVLALHL